MLLLVLDIALEQVVALDIALHMDRHCYDTY